MSNKIALYFNLIHNFIKYVHVIIICWVTEITDKKIWFHKSSIT